MNSEKHFEAICQWQIQQHSLKVSVGAFGAQLSSCSFLQAIPFAIFLRDELFIVLREMRKLLEVCFCCSCPLQMWSTKPGPRNHFFRL